MPTSTKKSSSKAKKASKKSTAKKKSAVKKKSTATKSRKKTTKKKVAKKSTATKSNARSPKALVCADGKECFWTTDGQILKDLIELRDALKSMDEKVFAAHVNRERNDFAEWVEQVLKDAECAAALRKSRKPRTARTVVVRHLKFYNV